MDDALKRHILSLLEADQREDALDALLDAAASAPSDVELRTLLDAVAAAHPLRRDPPYGCLEWGYRSIRQQLPDAIEEWGFVLYTLPEFRRCDTQLLPEISPGLRFSSRQIDHIFMTTPERIGSSMPLHAPIVRDPYTWQPPRVSYEGGVLALAQSSRYNDGHGDVHYETTGLSIYRVAGALFHARYIRYGYWAAAE